MGTNYESAYLVLLAGVEAVFEEIHHRDPVSTDGSIDVSGDSQLVRNHVSGDSEAKHPGMHRFRDQAQAILDGFGHEDLVHQNRFETV